MADVPPLSIQVVHLPRVHYAMQQNDVPIVRELALTNAGAIDLVDLDVRVTFDGGLAKPLTLHVDRIPVGGTWRAPSLALDLDGEVLVRQTEREKTKLRVRVTNGDALIAESDSVIEVLAYDAWSGLATLPEILAAFVLPNHPDVARILSAASAHLLRATGSGSLSGYQDKDPRRVRAIVAAVYAALQDLGIAYANPPAGFEQDGQRVRSPDQIVATKLATCLDLALLVAACLEQAGLHALVVLVRGHAFAGAWTREESFPEAAHDDGLRVRKRVQLGEIVVFETTCVTDPARPSLDHAEREAHAHLRDLEPFLIALDVAAARRLHIRPLPFRIEAGAVAMAPIAAAPTPIEPAPTGPASTAAPAPASDAPARPRVETPVGRLERWKRKLLDLSLRNRFLHLRETRRTIPLLGADLAELENALSSGVAFTLRSKEAAAKAQGPRSTEAHRERTGTDLVDAFLADELAHGRLYASLDASTLDARLVHLFRETRVELEESGAATLYLALGFLVWFESPASTEPRRAPILLLPLLLERSSVRDSFKLRLADEDPRINETLLEKLRAEFPHIDTRGLDEMSEDESGLDVKQILDRFRVAVKDQPRFDVEDAAVVGSFSFAKFLMWLDLESRAQTLLQTPIVRHLVEHPDTRFEPDTPFTTAETLDATWQLSRSFCPLDADSSQLAAIASATAGASFVLQGPPGTGKSQTIVNLIAQTLAEGKRVLFVAEKRAALSVVHERLKKVGLEPFCLELHSNKVNKTAVLKQLEAALDAEAGRGDTIASAAPHDAVRAELNAYVEATHRQRPLGYSVFQARARALALDGARDVALECDAITSRDAAWLDRARAALEVVPAAIDAAGAPHDHPLRGLCCTQWTSSLPDQLESSAKVLDAACAALGAALEPVRTACAVAPGTSLDLAFARALVDVARLLVTTPGPTKDLVLEPGFAECKAHCLALVQRGRDRDALASALRMRWRDEFVAQDPAAWRTKLIVARDALPVMRWFKLRSVQAELKPFAAGALQDVEPVLQDLDAIVKLRAETDALRASDGARWFGARWNDGRADWAALEQAIAYVDALRAKIARLAGGDVAQDARVRERIATLASTERDQLAHDAPLGIAFRAVAARWSEFDAARAAFVAAFHVGAGAALEASSSTLDAVRAELARWRGARGRLREWCHWQTVRARIVDCAHPALVDALERDELRADELAPAFEKAVLRRWLDATIDQDEHLRPFISREHERKIARFRALDLQGLAEASTALQTKLAARVPQQHGPASESSEVGLLLREIAKKRRRLPVRRLIEKLPTLLPRLKPCFLMSPLSVAQALDPAMPPFDVVVFDEASQIPVWDAIGAMARGTHVVVVGDSKQLPPTNFFQKLEPDDEEPDEDEVEELESILDECVAAGLTQLSLRWHYRSRHESLIAFSNAHYYGNKLLTFPGPTSAADGLGVSLVHLDDARYDRAQSRANRKEAEAVVAEMMRRLETKPEESLGVVTFGQAQQTLIQDLLDAQLRTHPALERFFTDAVPEPTFVKNLENVQGDERDVMLFSVCYGPDEQGKVAMNFGPLNREGGERRLNVAITRARRQVVVFTCLHPDQIDLARTRAVGVKHLKTFLDYARRGPLAIAEATTLPRGADFESPFEAHVHAALTAHGHDVDLQIGCSGYRIDLAVKDPTRPGRYVLGIECDGAFYHRAATARDRDRLRGEVLARLGWTLHRVWSTDWYADRDRTLARIEQAIADALAKNALPKPVASVDAAPTPPVATELASEPMPTQARAAPVLERYVRYSRPQPLGTAMDLATAATDARASEAFAAIVQTEAPVREDIALERLAGLYQVTRVTQRVLDRLEPVARAVLASSTVKRIDDVLWTTMQDPARWRSFRVPQDDGSEPRSAEELPTIEVANAAAWILAQQLSLDVADLCREIARQFGYARLGSTVKARMEAGIDVLIARGEAVRDGDRVKVFERHSASAPAQP